MYEGKKTNFQAILDNLAGRYDLNMPGKVGDILDHLSPILEKIPSSTPKNGALSKTNLSALKNFVKEPKREVRDYLREDPDPDTKKNFQENFEFLSEMIEKEHERLSQPIDYSMQEEEEEEEQESKESGAKPLEMTPDLIWSTEKGQWVRL